MSLHGYKPKWKKRSYLGPAAESKAVIGACATCGGSKKIIDVWHHPKPPRMKKCPTCCPSIRQKAANQFFGFNVKSAPPGSLPKGVTGVLVVTDPKTWQPDLKRSMVIRRGPSAATIERRAKKRKSDRLYSAMSKEWLKRPENHWCRVASLRDKKLTRARHVHHIRGRHRTLKFDIRFFCPTAPENDLWPHEKIGAARALGLIAGAGDWHREPGDAETQRIREWMQQQGIW